MDRKMLFENYRKSLNRKYNAVCFDIDGTLTVKNSKFIDNRAIDMIINLLSKKIPVVFITGRGETGLKDFKSDIYERIIKNDKIKEDDLKRIYVLTNDGARLFYSISVTLQNFLNESVYISTQEEFEQLLLVDKVVKQIKNRLCGGNYFDITYSKDLNTSKILNVRMVFNTSDEEMVNLFFDKVDGYIRSHNLTGVYLTRGIYKNCSVIQIGTTTKDKAIERTEEIIGVPRDSMIRIGDCGDLRGNDYSMLNCSQGYSVNKISESVDACFPIFDHRGNILKGVDATLHLIKNAQILPTVCLEKANKNDYVLGFAKVESGIVLGRKVLLKKYNDLISKNFNNCNVIDDLFDKNSGSIIIPMYEMELLENSPLKELWLSTFNDNLSYSLRDNSNYLLRGSKTYYYFISNRLSINGKDITSKENVINWHNNYLEFLSDAYNAILSTKNVNDQFNKKMLLGILDNCRNILLVLVNSYLLSNYPNKSILFEMSLRNGIFVSKLYDALIKVESLMGKICFETWHIIDKEKILAIVNDVKTILLYNLEVLFPKNEKDEYSKDYRAYREIDNFAENYIAVSLYKEKCNSNQHVNACGLSYGGIELPFLAKVIDNNILNLLLLKFSGAVSGYSNKQLIDLRNFNINNFGGLTNSAMFSNSNVDLFDDNVLTGKTLQLAVNSLYDCNIAVNNICIVRYPSLNRIDQMFLDNPAAVDYNLFFNYIYGLCFSSPYSFKDDSWKNKSGLIDYTDSLGVFDLNRKKIVECLLKNHDYFENSEVGEYKRRVLK